MVTVNPAAVKSKVLGAFTALGESFTLRTITSPGTFNPTTGEYDGRAYTDRVVSGINAGRERRWMNGALVMADDYVVYIYDDGLGSPNAQQKLLLGGEEVAIQRVDEYQLKGTLLAYRVVLVR